jgi:hypothetical protein
MPKPETPALPPTPRMPDPDDPAVKEARKRAQEAVYSRTGRRSTILSA